MRKAKSENTRLIILGMLAVPEKLRPLGKLTFVFHIVNERLLFEDVGNSKGVHVKRRSRYVKAFVHVNEYDVGEVSGRVDLLC